MNIWSFFTLSLWSILSLADEPLSLSESAQKLMVNFREDIQTTQALVGDPEQMTALDRYRLTYQLPSLQPNNRDMVARGLFVLYYQQEQFDRYLAEIVEESSETIRGNHFLVDYGMKFLRAGMMLGCERCSPEKKREYRRAVDDYLKIMDLRGAELPWLNFGSTEVLTENEQSVLEVMRANPNFAPGNGFSGLPFYELMQEKFQDENFQRNLIALSQNLERMLSDLSQDSSKVVDSNILDEAIKITGSREVAVEMLGLMMSRDSLNTRYFKHFRSSNSEFMKSFANFPVLVKVLADLDRHRRNIPYDRFSYDGVYRTTNTRSYYFWSAALTSQKLKSLGYADDIVFEAAFNFPKQYRVLRFLESRSFLKSSEEQARIRRANMVAMNISAYGSQVSLGRLSDRQRQRAHASRGSRINHCLSTIGYLLLSF